MRTSFLRLSTFRPLDETHEMIVPFLPLGSFTIMLTSIMPIVSTIVNSGWGTNDRYSITGALIAGAISAIQSRTTNKVWWHTISVFVASVFLGIIIPALIMFWKYADQWDNLTWHSWAGMGFVAGLGGWALTDMICKKLVPATVDRIEKRARIIIGTDTQEIK